jgi:hypothetical protein
VLAQPELSKDRLVSREFSLRVVNGRDVSPSSCRVTVGGASFVQTEKTESSIHALKLTQSHSSIVPVRLVPQVNEMAIGELQSVLVQSPPFGGCAIVIATLDTTSIPVLPAGAVILGTLTLTMSDVAP